MAPEKSFLVALFKTLTVAVARYAELAFVESTFTCLRTIDCTISFGTVVGVEVGVGTEVVLEGPPAVVVGHGWHGPPQSIPVSPYDHTEHRKRCVNIYAFRESAYIIFISILTMKKKTITWLIIPSLHVADSPNDTVNDICGPGADVTVIVMLVEATWPFLYVLVLGTEDGDNTVLPPTNHTS